MDRLPMTDDEIARCEQVAADEEAERMYQQMCDDGALAMATDLF
jgi:hypothetical protein